MPTVNDKQGGTKSAFDHSSAQSEKPLFDCFEQQLARPVVTTQVDTQRQAVSNADDWRYQRFASCASDCLQHGQLD